jgi:hypothetical protein
LTVVGVVLVQMRVAGSPNGTCISLAYWNAQTKRKRWREERVERKLSETGGEKPVERKRLR